MRIVGMTAPCICRATDYRYAYGEVRLDSTEDHTNLIAVKSYAKGAGSALVKSLQDRTAMITALDVRQGGEKFLKRLGFRPKIGTRSFVWKRE